MSVYLILPVIEVVFCLGLLGLLFVLGQKHIARRPFAFFLVLMAVWGGFIFMLRATADMGEALLWEKFVFCAIISAAIIFYRFTMSLTGSSPSKAINFSLYALYAVLIALIPSGLVVHGMQMLWYGKAPVIGPMFPLYVIGIYLPIVLALRMLIKHGSRSRVIDERSRDQYIVFGIILMLVGGTTDYLPAVGVSMYPLGIIGNILFCVLTTVAMLRYGLLEMRFVLRKGATYSLVSMFIFGVFGCLIILLGNVFQQLSVPVSLTITVLAAFTIAAIFQPILSGLQKTVDRWFFRERYDYMQALKAFGKETKGNLDLHQLSSSLVTAVANGMQATGVYLLLPSPATGNLINYASSGQKPKVRLSFNNNSALAVTMKYQDGLIDTNDMDIIPSLSGLADADRQILLKNDIELLMPLKHSTRLVGMLLMSGRRSREPYSKEDRQLLQSILTDVSVNIENANRFESVKREKGEMQKAMEGIIYAISLVVETRDPYTAGHQRRVAELAKAIASEMGLSDWQIRGINIAGLLHDVGKVAVPSEILSKPGKISQYEFSIIKNHPRTGFEILEKIDFPWAVPQAILQHHERLNGTGYPEALAGEEIMLEARILGVADVVEAMSSHRPYRAALGLDAALKEIIAQRDVLYDGQVVDACLKLLQKDPGAFEKLMVAAASTASGNLEEVKK